MNNAKQVDSAPVVKRETKNKIRVDFERTPLKERLKAKFLNLYFLGNIVWWIFRLVLMVGISYIVLFPFFTKISGSFMSPEDFVDVTVRLIPKHFTLDIYEAIIEELNYWTAFRNTFILSLICAVIQTFICALIGYGFAKFKFRGRNLLFLLVMLTMIIPHPTLRSAIKMSFANFDILGIVKLLNGGGIEIFGYNIKDIGPDVAAFFEKIDLFPNNELKIFNGQTLKVTEDGISLLETYTPMILLSLGGLAFKNGLYIFLFRQFFRGIPDELEESAYMDGSGVYRTFFQIILPLSVPMLITVFLFSFCWQWSDAFYTEMFFTANKTPMLAQLPENITKIKSLNTNYAGQALYESAIRNTTGIMIIFPLVILYAFGQKFLVQGIEQSGLAN